MRPLSSEPPANTKLIATLGPATDSPDKLAALLAAGVDVCRLNFSHGELESHGRTLSAVRAWARANRRHVAVLGDLCGPKIRLNQVHGGSLELKTGEAVRFVRGTDECVPGRLTVNYPRFVDEVDVGRRVYIDDGLVRVLIVEREADALLGRCTVGGRISSRKGVNLPDSALSTPALTQKDRADLEWAIEHELDYVALSFARRPEDLDELLDIRKARGSDVGVIVKIEKVEALEHLDSFIARASGLMVARGDLGVEMDVWQVPLIQKAITARCREAGRPVIVATQMLQSMVAAPIPTRAEVSDVANAILDGADAVMLSAETASGEYPIEAVDIMRRVGVATEAFRSQIRGLEPAPSLAMADRRSSAVAAAAVQAALDLNARLVAVWTTSGETVRLVARHRLPMPVVGLAVEERVLRRMNLLHGVIPLHTTPLSHPGEMARVLDERLLSVKLAAPGDVVVVVTSTRPHHTGNTDTTLVHRVGSGPVG